MQIEILGPGCRNCETLEQRVREAVTSLGVDSTVNKITDFAAIAARGVLSTPALVVDGRVVVSGRVPAVAELQRLLTATGTSVEP